MKQLSLIAAAATLALSGLAHSPEASATVICTSCSYNQATNGNLFIGNLVSTTGDLSNVTSGSTLASNAAFSFSQVFVFNFSPIGSASSSLTFTPSTEISNFKLELLNATVGACPVLVVFLGQGFGNGGCTGLTLGTSIAFGTTNPNNAINLPFTPLFAAGYYAIRVTGDVAGATSVANQAYNGAVTTIPVPEPVSLALVGIALVGAGLASRSRKA